MIILKGLDFGSEFHVFKCLGCFSWQIHWSRGHSQHGTRCRGGTFPELYAMGLRAMADSDTDERIDDYEAWNGCQVLVITSFLSVS